MGRLARSHIDNRPARMTDKVTASFVVVAGIVEGWLGSRGVSWTELVGLLVLIVAALALFVSPSAFVGLALLVIGTDSISQAHPLRFAGAEVYALDILLAIVLLRAFLPRERVRTPAPLQGVTRVCIGAWVLIMVAAGFRAAIDGYRIISIIRLAVPVLYGIGFYFGLGRIIRERRFDIEGAARNLLVVSLGLVAYMAFARVTNTPFENEANPAIGHLGTVVTTAGVLRRDYGLGSAFVVYPAFGLAAAAYLLHRQRRIAVAAGALGIGALATLLTLIRSEIFGFFLGLAVIAFLRTRGTTMRMGRASALVAGSFVLLVGGFGLWATSPSTARGVTERSLPGLVRQSASAEENANFRKSAVKAGLAGARRHPFGVGLVPDQSITAKSGVDVGYIAHSGLTATAAYTGWVGLIIAALALLSLLRQSFLSPRPISWLHPFFVGSFLMLIFYTAFGAAGLVGQGGGTALAALIAALRFQGPASTG